MKQCRKCKRILSLDNFYRDKIVKDGHNSQCKKCEGEYRKGWREKFGWAKARELVRIRDNHTCKICGKKWVSGRRFHVHHLDCDNKKTQQFDKFEIEKDNMITLCPSCHKYLHDYVRKFNLSTSQSFFDEFFSD